jgi:hypothetical protein
MIPGLKNHAMQQRVYSPLAQLLHILYDMKKILGTILLIIGIVMVIWTGFSFTRREKVVDAGPLHISADKEHTVNWPPYAGGILALAGIVLLVLPEKKN